ncbi:hypothetical protein VTJ04DRAFT_8491 [Mycothermus thermophilus]|uniref:uncharacterized protein n=1 Tax=Humicola insolens TaxID=85995 RepID=UPI00374404C3
MSGPSQLSGSASPRSTSQKLHFSVSGFLPGYDTEPSLTQDAGNNNGSPQRRSAAIALPRGVNFLIVVLRPWRDGTCPPSFLVFRAFDVTHPRPNLGPSSPAQTIACQSIHPPLLA